MLDEIWFSCFNLFAIVVPILAFLTLKLHAGVHFDVKSYSLAWACFVTDIVDVAEPEFKVSS